MANTYKNIVITPNRDTDAANVPFIRFSGGDATSNTDINVRVYTTQSGTLSFEGSAGQLFSITNDLTNTIFSVNDVSGIPSLEIDAAGLIKIAEFSGNVAIGRSNASHKLDIVGTANASNILVNGNMVFTAANDGAGSNLDADLLDGQQGAYYGIATDVSAANRVANAAFLNANAGYAFANSSHAIANLAFVHANAAYTQANAAIASASAGQATANAAFTRANNSLLSSAYTAADVLAKLITVDGAGTSLDADLLDGQQGTYYGIAADVTAAFLRANNSLLSSSYTAADVLAKLITVDGAGTNLDADLLDGQQGTYYGIAADVTAAFLRANNSLLSSSYTAADVLSKLITVDGAGTNLDADLLDGQQGTYYGIATDVTAANRVANAAFLHSNAAFAFGNSAHSIANLAFTHANSAFATANGRVSSVSGTGTVSGLTLSGTVTTTGSLTLGGTLSASVIDNMTDEHRLFNNMGDIHATRTAFDITGPSINFGWRFVQGSTNGPGVTGTQFYSEYVGLGNEYSATGAGSYGMQIAYPRNVTEPYITIRYNEANTFTAWTKVSAGNSDKLNSQAASYYGIASDVTAAFLRANNSLLSSSYTAADVLSKLLTVDGAGTNLDADLLDGQQGSYYGIATDVTAAFLRANNSLLSSSYTAADVLSKLLTVDGAGTTLDADFLDGQHGSYYGIAADVTAAFLRANNSLLSSSYTAADVLAKLITVDGAGTTLDADLLDGQQGAYYGIASDVTAAFLRANNSLLSSSYTAADVLAKLITVDGAGTTLDADLLDGQHGSYYGISTDVAAANRVANAAFLHANAAFLQANTGGVGPAFEQANTARTHANQAFAKANTIGTLGTQASSSVTITGGSITGITDITVADGGTGASDAATARTNLGLAIGTNVQAYSARLGDIAGLSPTSDNFIVGNGTAWTLETPALARTSLGLGTIATQAASSVSITGGSVTGITDLAVADGGTGASDAGTARTNLGLVIGTNVQAYSARLGDIAGLSPTSDNFIVGNGTAWTLETPALARTSLGLGTIATQASSSVSITGGSITGITDLAVADGGTGASDAATARTNLGLVIGTNVQAYSANYLVTTGNQTLTGGFNVTPFNLGTGSGTVTPSGLNGNYQYITNNAAFTIAAPGTDSAIDILVTNGATAGSITFSGYTAGAANGSIYALTNANRYLLSIRRINSIATFSWYALQ